MRVGACMCAVGTDALLYIFCFLCRLVVGPQGATIYEDGYDRDSLPIRWFWEVVNAWGEEVSGPRGPRVQGSCGCKGAL